MAAKRRVSRYLGLSPKVWTVRILCIDTFSEGAGTPHDRAGTQQAEVDVTFKIAKCSVALKEKRAALAELETIPSRNRTLQINLCLAKLYQDINFDRAAVACYKVLCCAAGVWAILRHIEAP